MRHPLDIGSCGERNRRRPVMWLLVHDLLRDAGAEVRRIAAELAIKPKERCPKTELTHDGSHRLTTGALR